MPFWLSIGGAQNGWTGLCSPTLAAGGRSLKKQLFFNHHRPLRWRGNCNFALRAHAGRWRLRTGDTSRLYIYITVSHFAKVWWHSDKKRQVSNGSIASHSAPRLSPFSPSTNPQLLGTKNPFFSPLLMKATRCPERIKHMSAPYSTSTVPLVPVPGRNV